MRKSVWFLIGISLILKLAQLDAGEIGRQQLAGHVPKFIATAPILGAVPVTLRLQLAIGLPFRNQEALQQLLSGKGNLKNIKYHLPLTNEQILDMFSPSQNDYQAVISFAESNGLAIVDKDSLRTLLFVNGTVGDIEKVFHINLNYYKQPNGNSYYAPDKEPSIDLDVPILHISGLTPMVFAPGPQFKITGKSLTTNEKTNSQNSPATPTSNVK